MRTPALDSAPLANLLLIEPQFVLRRTIVAVAQELGIALFQETASVDSATPRLAAKPFDGVVIDTSCGVAAFELVARLRGGTYPSRVDIPVIAMSQAPIDAACDARLLLLGNVVILRKPFKVAELLQLVQRTTSAADKQAH